ncbi:MAG: hypothetical protein GXY33_00240 [Phycisphaerae bacterium]|nr:hypothetical protein [Phycisphaerae bacterium]
MEERFAVNCPHCRQSYRVRYSTLGRDAVCAQCKQTFRLLVPEYHGEDEILAWLERGQEKPANGTVAGLKIVDSKAEPQSTPQAIPSPSSTTAGGQRRLHLYKVDPTRAFFWFPAELLHQPGIRASFPQRCVKTLSKDDLHIYLVHWSATPSPLAPTEHHGKPKPVATLEQFPAVPPVELLEFLPKSYGDEPFSLPMPYYASTGVDPTGIVRTSISGNGAEQRCWLSISNLEVARRFYAAVQGDHDEEYQKLRFHSDLRRKDRWGRLSGHLQTSLLEWYRPLSDERFIKYLPDEETPRTANGSSGIIITDRRLVFHKDRIWRAYPLEEPLTVRMQEQVDGGAWVEVFSVAHGRAVTRLSSKSWANLKHYLTGLEARAKFFG